MTIVTVRACGSAWGPNLPAVYEMIAGESIRMVDPGTQYLDGVVRAFPTAIELATHHAQTLGLTPWDVQVGDLSFRFDGPEFTPRKTT